MKKIIIVVAVVVILIAVAGLLVWKLWPSQTLPAGENKLTEKQKELARLVDERMAETKSSENKNIIVNSPKLGEMISSPLIITGQINGEGWSGFEGQAGTVQLLDEKMEVLGSTILEPTTDWMRLPTKFKATLEFSSSKEQSGMLVFKNENPSGMLENNREFVLVIKLGKMQ